MAIDVATAAGSLLHRGWGGPREVSTKSTPTDVVTEMDRASEALIRDRILAVRPDDGILGEEGGERIGIGGRRWIVDPLDGTVNYLYGLAHWAVSIALEVDGHVVAGAVVAPVLGEVFAASAGGGAWRRLGGRVGRLCWARLGGPARRGLAPGALRTGPVCAARVGCLERAGG